MKKVITVLFLFFSTLLNAQWSEQTSGVNAALTSVYAVNKNVAWVCGYSSTVLRTKNEGLNWQKVDGNGFDGIPGNINLINIVGFDTSTAIVSGYQGTNTWAWRTTNSGQNWIEVFYEYNGFVDGVCMLSPTNGILVGDPVGGRWSLWRTTNAGNTWDSAGLYLPAGSTTEGGYNNCLFGVSPKIWFGTNNSRVYYSSNGGLNWSIQSITPEVNSYSLWFSQSSAGLSGGANLMQTTNGGLNWTSFASSGSGNIAGITSAAIPVYFPFSRIWIVRNASASIYASNNGGANWSTEYTTTVGTYRHISNASPGLGIWAVGTTGCITYHQPITGIIPINSIIPDKYSLSQNYPNPFNPVTTIEFALAHAGHISLTIYDLKGREYASGLKDLSLFPGRYKMNFNGSNLSSGVYFYSLIVDGKNMATKKMILIK